MFDVIDIVLLAINMEISREPGGSLADDHGSTRGPAGPLVNERRSPKSNRLVYLYLKGHTSTGHYDASVGVASLFFNKNVVF